MSGDVHLQTSASRVKCGAPMRDWRDPESDGWDLGTVTVEPARVTCPECAPRIQRVAFRACAGHTDGDGMTSYCDGGCNS